MRIGAHIVGGRDDRRIAGEACGEAACHGRVQRRAGCVVPPRACRGRVRNRRARLRTGRPSRLRAGERALSCERQRASGCLVRWRKTISFARHSSACGHPSLSDCGSWTTPRGHLMNMAECLDEEGEQRRSQVPLVSAGHAAEHEDRERSERRDFHEFDRAPDGGVPSPIGSAPRFP